MLAVAFKFSLWQPDITYTGLGSIYSFGNANSGSNNTLLGAVSGTVSFQATSSNASMYKLEEGFHTIYHGETITGAGSERILMPFKATIPLIEASASDRLCALNFDYKFIKVYKAGAFDQDYEFRVKIANLTAMIGRTLQNISTSGNGEAFTQYVKGGGFELPPAFM